MATNLSNNGLTSPLCKTEKYFLVLCKTTRKLDGLKSDLHVCQDRKKDAQNETRKEIDYPGVFSS